MYSPVFKGPIEGYVVNHLRKNLWKLAGTHDHCDAMQEAYLVFMRVSDRYPQMDTPQHFMALFKTAWERHFIDLSHKATKSRNIQGWTDLGHDNPPDSIGELENSGYLLTLLRQAPAEVLLVLNLCLNAPQELLELAARAWEAKGSKGEVLLCRMLGLPEDSAPIQTTKEYLSHKSDPV